MNEQCARCHRPMLRTGTVPDGFVRHRGNGNCDGCWQVSRPSSKAKRALTYRGPAHCYELDEVVVERLLAGDLDVPCNAAEMHAAIDVLEARRFSARQTADRLGITTRAVQRHRARTRAVAA